MVAGHAVVGLPKHGKGVHPENASLALDGRGRSSMAARGSTDGEEHLGSFFWMVGRNSKAKDANMELQNVTFAKLQGGPASSEWA